VPHDVSKSRRAVTKPSDSNPFARNMIENVADEIGELLLRPPVHAPSFTPNDRQHVVVFLAVFDLLHQANGLAFHDLARLQPAPGQHETIHVQAVVGRGVQNESVGKRVRARNPSRPLPLQSFFVVMMLQKWSLRRFGRTLSSKASGFQHPPRDHQPLDFAGAFVNFRDARIAVRSLDRVFAAVAVAAVNLDGLVRHARGHLARE
jgi:hypothetical protein